MQNDFTSEDDLKTFEGWLKYQCIDAASLTASELGEWRRDFEDAQSASAAMPKVGLMKLRPVPGENRYAVALREGPDLWLTLWVRRSKKGEFFVMVPRKDPGWDVHSSYHLDGTFHMKSFGHKSISKKLQPLTGPFKGTEHLGAHGGHGPKSVGAICNPDAFNGVVEVQPGILGPRDGDVVVDLVQPNCEPLSWPGVIVDQKIFRDTLPWIVIRIVDTRQRSSA
jgi:hypothetical protein